MSIAQRKLQLSLCFAVLCLAAACGDDDSAGNSNDGGKYAGADASSGKSDAGSGALDGATPEEDGGDDADLMVTLADGMLQGDYSGKSIRFLKIPFAQPPLGDLRWKAPMTPDAWMGVRHEKDFAGPCAQNASAGSPVSENEDCLYLNVWTPDPMPQKAAVLFWIHGGGNLAGSTFNHVPMTQDLWFDGQYFAERHGVIVVTTNYRLGPMGFFAHPDLAGEDSPLGNQGLLDQRMAMQWVQDNIAKFGGDPDNVTIFGESAGSADVCYHVAAPGSRGLFAHAISESGGCTAGLNGAMREKTASDVADGMVKFTKAMGCDKAADALKCLRGKSVKDILANAMQPNPMATMTTTSDWSFGVVIDGKGGFLPKSAREYYDAGDIAKVPYILGSNNDEGTLFTYMVTAAKNDKEYMAQLTDRFGDNAAKIFAEYPVSKFKGDYAQALARVVGDSGLVCGTHDSARRAVTAGLSVFMYNFNIPWQVGAGALGATHASEISHVFGSPLMPDADSMKVSDAMNAYWAQFAKTGDPNFKDAPQTWPAFKPDSGDHDKRLQFDADFKVIDDFRREECQMWREIYQGQ